MAIRKIRELGDEVLTKPCKEVTKMTLRTKILINDMLDTMYEAMGVGLAAPQVGILKRIVTIDIGEGPIVLINPEILETSGEQTGEEGCLSVPGKAGLGGDKTELCQSKALNEDMEEIVLEGEELLPELSAMRSIIWMVRCMLTLWKADFTMWSHMRRKFNESHFYGDSGFFRRNIRGTH